MYSFHAVGDKYRCLVENDLTIDSPEKVQIETVSGTHMSGKSNDDEIYFHMIDKPIQYFPRGMEKFFKNLKGIALWGSQIKEIHQEDLKPYQKLENLFFSSSNIEIIEEGLFDFNPDMDTIIFQKSKIFHISPTVFNNLPKLTTLYLEGNKCTNKDATNSRTGTLEVINSVKVLCISTEFLYLDATIKTLEKS